MKIAVIDTGVLVAGIFWRHESHLCLRAWLRGILLPVVSEEVFAEYAVVLERVKTENHFNVETQPWLEAIRKSALWVTPSPLEHQVCRDPKDDKFLATALAAGVRTLIARDRDLTVLQKPFGIEILTPRAWLATLPRKERRLLT